MGKRGRRQSSSDSISPIDGRYRGEASPLSKYFSERGLMTERVNVELAYLRLLVRLRIAPSSRVPKIEVDLDEIDRLEKRLGHDVKAVEVFIRGRLEKSGFGKLAPFVHMGLTSEDTNSLAFAVTLKSALGEVLLPAYASLATKLAALAEREASTAMVGRTHGRPAVPTTFGKEVAVFAVRLSERISQLNVLAPMAKFSGAVGTYASFKVMGDRDWRSELSKFVEGFGVDPADISTQVVPGERLSDILHLVININQLMSSLSKDMWLYQAIGYVEFLRPGKVSSSTMPQKVNPVDIENAEGQVDISNSLLLMIAYRMQVTRLQRDLSDSVVRRMTGQALAHSLVACGRLTSSLSSLKVDRRAMLSDLRRHPEVLAERDQILKRLKGDPRGYEKVKQKIDQGRYSFGSDPTTYLGDAVDLAMGATAKVKELMGRGPNRNDP